MNLGYFYYKVLMERIINTSGYQQYLETFDKNKALNIENLKDENKSEYKNNKNKDKNIFFKDLLNFRPSALEEEFVYKGFEKKEFTLEVKGKGLFIGIGYTHEIPSVKGQLINGFYFDYTTGLPVIPGSSIKGAIRSVFPYSDDELKVLLKNASQDKQFLYKEINQGKKEFLEKLLQEMNLSNINILELRDEIFDYGDIFLDAYIVSKRNIFDIDYFAPHTDEFSHPVPLKFLKIKKGVEFKFRFLFNTNIKSLDINKREELFKKIILQNGLGAKTNENYGRFGKKNKRSHNR